MASKISTDLEINLLREADRPKEQETIKGYITRRVTTNRKDWEQEIPDEQLLDLPRPLVILGEPGAGKTAFAERLAETKDIPYFNAIVLLVRDASDLDEYRRVVVDGLDEVVAHKTDSPFVAILDKIPKTCMPVLTCRAADWKAATVSDLVYGRWELEPIVATLLPLNESEIVQFVAQELEEAKVKPFLCKAREDGAYDLLSNPQMLLMFVAVWKTGKWPDSKGKLFELSCRKYAEEANKIHQEADLADYADYNADQLLDAAGFIFAQMLLSGTAAFRATVSELSKFSSGSCPPASSDRYSTELIK